MFKLTTKYGNIVKTVETERERDNLIDLGYKVVDEDKPSIDNMTVPQLEDFAKENGIDISDCKNKSEKLDKIKNFVKEN